MPKHVLETPEATECISRPVVMTVVRQMAQLIGIPLDTPVRYAGKSASLPIPGSTLDDKEFKNRLPADAHLVIDVDDTYLEDTGATTAVLRPQNIVVFKDSALQVYLKPVYQPVKVEVSVTLTGTDETSVTRWLRTIRRQVTQGVAENLHIVDYHYPIPLPFMAILLEIHQLREANHGYGETIGQWLRKCFTPRFTTIGDQAGNNPLLVIREQQGNILGWYDFDAQPPKEDKKSDSGAWSIGFTYTFNYDRVESVVMQYPLMVHNQLLDGRFYNASKPYEIEDFLLEGSLSTTILRSFTYEARSAYAYKGRPGLPIPYFDDWLPETDPFKTTNLLRILLQRDPNSPNDLLSLNNMGVYRFPPFVLDYMRDYPVGMTILGESIFQINLYKGYERVDPTKLIIAQDLGIVLSEPLDPRGHYHLTVSLLYDFSLLSPDALIRLANHGELVVYLLATLDPTFTDPRLNPNADQRVYDVIDKIIGKQLESDPIGNDPNGSYDSSTDPTAPITPPPRRNPNFPTLPTVRPDGKVNPNELKNVINGVNDRNVVSRMGPDFFWRLVAAYTIKVHRS